MSDQLMTPNSEKPSLCEGSAESPVTTPATPVEKQPAEAETEPKTERIKATRHPRWTRQETLVLIEAKKVIESGEPGCRYRSTSGLIHTDPKWEMVSSLCQQHGVKRGAVQCRKRWGNLLTDYRKIKKWESGIKEEAESFWIMRNDVRKEKKLPGFFDAVVYNVLDGGVCTAAAFPLTLIKMTPKGESADQVLGMVPEPCKDDEEEDDEEEDDEAIVDSEKMGWSTEDENIEINTTGNNVNNPFKTPNAKKIGIRGSLKMTPTLALPSSERQQQPPCQGNFNTGCQREPMFHDGYKRRRLSPDNSEDSADFNDNVIKVLRRNTNILKAHLGNQNINYQLARDQQKQQTECLVAALGRLTDAITKIADKM